MASWRDRIAGSVNQKHIVELLETFESDGSLVEAPLIGSRDDYLNVRAPAGSQRRGRICSVNVRTGRVEFQLNSWDRLVVRAGFDHLKSGNKAARTPETGNDVEAIVMAFRNEVAKTR
jgi:hypothetical protein